MAARLSFTVPSGRVRPFAAAWMLLMFCSRVIEWLDCSPVASLSGKKESNLLSLVLFLFVCLFSLLLVSSSAIWPKKGDEKAKERRRKSF